MSRLRAALEAERKAKGVGCEKGQVRRRKISETQPSLKGATRLREEMRREIRRDANLPPKAKIHHLPMVQPIPHPGARGECAGGPRPCPLVGCRYNLYLDVERRDRTGEVAEEGAIRFNFPERAPEDMPPARSCALDVAAEIAESGEELSQEDVAQLRNVSTETIRQIEATAARKVRARLARLGFSREDVRRALWVAANDASRDRRHPKKEKAS